MEHDQDSSIIDRLNSIDVKLSLIHEEIHRHNQLIERGGIIKRFFKKIASFVISKALIPTLSYFLSLKTVASIASNPDNLFHKIFKLILSYLPQHFSYKLLRLYTLSNYHLYDYGTSPPDYVKKIIKYSGSRYESIRIGNLIINFHLEVFKDLRGVGRHARELVSQFRKISVIHQIYPQSHTTKTVFFYSTIHWCPVNLPINSFVMIHDVTPLVLPALFNDIHQDFRSKCIRLAQSSANIITISETSRQDIAKHLSLNSERISVISNGITDLSKFQEKPIAIPFDKYFVYLGAIDVHKNISIILQAIKLDSRLKLVIIGPTLDVTNLIHQKFPSIIDRVHVLGILSDNEIAFVLKKSCGLLFPSLYEGFGLPPLEAATLSIPSICSNRPAMNDLLNNAAIFCDPMIPTEWVHAMLDLMNDAPKRHRYGTSAFQATKKYDWNDAALKLHAEFLK